MAWFKKRSRSEVPRGRALARSQRSDESLPALQPRVIDVNAFRMLQPEWEVQENRPHLTVQAHPVASYLAHQHYERLLNEPARPGDKVIFMSGGPGTGKTNVRLSMTVGDGDILVDGLVSTFESALSRIDAALGSGREVEVHHLHRDTNPAALATLVRASRDGRIVTVDALVEGHVAANDLALGCEQHPSLAETYRDDPRVQCHFWICSEPDDDGMGFGFSYAADNATTVVREIDEPEPVYHWAPLPSRVQERARQIELGLSGDVLKHHLASYGNEPCQVWVETPESVAARLIPVFAGPFRPLWEREGYDDARGY